VISPEGCASILWRAPERAQEAAVAMRLTAREQQALGVIDEVVAEPGEGAHENPDETARHLAERIVQHLDALAGQETGTLVEARYARYRHMGEFATRVPTAPPPVERAGLADRIRALLQSGRAALAGGDSASLRPPPAELEDEPPLHEDV
ncbi:MAG: hypothetical protein M3253_06085, partial [Chloroflexota bacterium]|nr:hypothetical protein [Chloroflexota bacterium]